MAASDLLTPKDYRDATNLLVSLAVRDIEAVWYSLDTSDGVAVRRALESVMPDIVNTYGDAVAALAADRFEIAREAAGARGAYTAVIADTPAPERVNGSTRAVIGGLFKPNPDTGTVLQEVEAVAGRFIKEAGRETLHTNTRRDREALGWKRALTGDSNCGFCVMLAGRSVLYGSRETAGDVGHRYHTRCDCVPDPVYNKSAFLDDPQRKEFEQRYEEARDIAGSNPDDIAYAIRARSQGKSPEQIKKYLSGPRRKAH